ncbi:MAG: hypothetical protein K5657_04055 [Desulfovibrio sp.]|nr:hypothetical protein [Desulfovibrio sp.]
MAGPCVFGSNEEDIFGMLRLICVPEGVILESPGDLSIMLNGCFVFYLPPGSRF